MKLLTKVISIFCSWLHLTPETSDNGWIRCTVTHLNQKRSEQDLLLNVLKFPQLTNLWNPRNSYTFSIAENFNIPELEVIVMFTLIWGEWLTALRLIYTDYEIISETLFDASLQSVYKERVNTKSHFRNDNCLVITICNCSFTL